MNPCLLSQKRRPPEARDPNFEIARRDRTNDQEWGATPNLLLRELCLVAVRAPVRPSRASVREKIARETQAHRQPLGPAADKVICRSRTGARICAHRSERSTFRRESALNQLGQYVRASK